MRGEREHNVGRGTSITTNGLHNNKGGREVSTTIEIEPKVQLGTQVTERQSIALARLKAELRAKGVRKSIGELVGEGIELLVQKHGL
jgi:hypothetical protein